MDGISGRDLEVPWQIRRTPSVLYSGNVNIVTEFDLVFAAVEYWDKSTIHYVYSCYDGI